MMKPSHIAIKTLCLVAVCAIFAAGIFLLDNLQVDLTNRLNRVELLIVAESHSPLPAQQLETTPLDGQRYLLRCSRRLVHIPGAQELSLQAFSTRAHRAPQIACLVALNRSQTQWLDRDWGPPAQSLLEAAGISTTNSSLAYTTKFVFLGREHLAKFLVDLTYSVLLIGLVATCLSWKEDIAAATSALLRHPVLMFAPSLVATLVAVVMELGTRLFSTSPALNLFDSLVYAPIQEEIVFRFVCFTLVARHSNTIFAALFASMLFAIGHGYDLLGTINILCFGLAQQYLYVHYRSLSLCILSHMVANGVIAMMAL